MLTNREYKLLLYFCEHPNVYLTSNNLASTFNVSSRTIKSDLESLKSYCINFKFLELISKKGKGTILVVVNFEEFQKLTISLKKEKHSNIYDEQYLRVKKITLYLLSKKQYVSKYKLQNTFFISESTLYQDIKEVKKLVQVYQLDIIQKKNKGYKITGSEINKRKCILNEQLFKISEPDNGYTTHIEFTTELAKTVTSILDKYEYYISDFLLQNLLIHIALMFQRMSQRKYINEFNNIVDIEHTIEYQISKEIVSNYINVETLPDNEFNYEICYLATVTVK